jgi:RHS repeat-associated protein
VLHGAGHFADNDTPINTPFSRLRAGSGLTQVLNDGTNQYLYGIGRIAQVNTTTLVTDIVPLRDYFLTDALGSVRQLTDSQGEVTLANAYEPYGSVSQSAGSAQTSYGFTGEFTDPSGMVYLRARYYMPGDGRFITRDTWMGDTNRPLSLNRWMYVEGNPVNFTDPSGNDPDEICGYLTYYGAKNYVEKYVDLPKWDWLNTYTAAGIALQCAGRSLDGPWSDPDYSGFGPGQITKIQIETEYGVMIPDPDDPDNNQRNRGFGLLCYVVLKANKELGKYISCAVCKTRDEMDSIYGPGNYFLETPHDRNNIKWAVEYMRRRIKIVTDACVAAGCSSTDIYIAAALAQNGSGLTKFNLDNWLTVKKNRINSDSLTLNWFKYFEEPGNWRDTSWQLIRFEGAINALKTTWYIPRDVNFDTIHKLKKIGN